jgi:hypothetical protein
MRGRIVEFWRGKMPEVLQTFESSSGLPVDKRLQSWNINVNCCHKADNIWLLYVRWSLFCDFSSIHRSALMVMLCKASLNAGHYKFFVVFAVSHIALLVWNNEPAGIFHFLDVYWNISVGILQWGNWVTFDNFFFTFMMILSLNRSDHKMNIS